MTTANHNERSRAGRQATDRRLQIQLVIFALIFVVLTTLAVVQVIRDGIDPFWPLLGFAVGLLIGAMLVRSKALGWDASAHVVVSSLSIGGIVVTIAYLILMVVLRDRIVGAVVDDAATVGVVGLTITGGVMLGRVLVTVRDIRRILTDAGILGGPQE